MTIIQDLAGKHLILGITGGIAAYKSADLCRRLQASGATVQVIMTSSACQFITPLTLQALSGLPVLIDEWDITHHNNIKAMPHIDISRRADAIIIAPATANFIAKLTHGLANDLLSTLCLARNCQTVPLFIAPAMNTEMWSNPATVRNITQLKADGIAILGPAYGLQACGETGFGRLLDINDMIHCVVAHFQPKVLQGKHVLITAGATFEPIDPVRGITNISSGKMGYALAQSAWEAGAKVLLISSTYTFNTLPIAQDIQVMYTQSARDMQAMVESYIDNQDIFFSVAAVSDWRVDKIAVNKIKKSADNSTYTLEMVKNPDILMAIAASNRAKSGKLYCVGFAAETENFDHYAQEKRLKKGVPLLVGNNAIQAMKSDENALTLYDDYGITRFPLQPKLIAARALIAEVAQRIINK